MGSTLISQAGLALWVAASVVALAGCSSLGEHKSAHMLRIAAEENAASAEQALADAGFASAVANALEKIAARGQSFDVDPDDISARKGITGMLLPGSDATSGSGEVITSQSSRDGGYVTSSLPWRNDTGQLEFYVEIAPNLQPDPVVSPTRYVDTSYRQGEFEGFTTSYGPIETHRLGAGWQAFQATNVYEGGGTLTIRFHTDADHADALGRPWANQVFLRPEARHDIVLNDIPSLPAGQDWRSISLSSDGLAGSLNGVEGRFSCPSDSACSLDNERLPPGWEGYHAGYDSSNLVIFTPADGGLPARLRGSDSQAVPPGDYLSFGTWLYVPLDASDVGAFDIGVFAAGRDPFSENNLLALTGTATYIGKAAGIYAAAAYPATHYFYAAVELTADFGTASELGAVGGEVSEFALDSGEPAPLNQLRLLPVSWRNGAGIANIFPSNESGGAALPGGWIEGYTAADGGWLGVWSGRFFGNGLTAADVPDSYAEHPGSFAGTFGATDGNHSVAGSFGAHKADRQD